MKTFRTISGFLLLVQALLFCCMEPEHDKGIEVEIPPDTTQVIMPPAGEFVIRNDTAIILGHDRPPMVHSFPAYAGVPDVGDIGLASAMGFDKGQRITIPCNVNLGNKLLASYEVRLTVERPDVLEVVTIEGSNSALSTYFPGQYKRAPGFESLNVGTDVQDGATLGVMYILPKPTQEPATGRINLFNLLVDLNDNTPAGGTWIRFEMISFKDPGDNELCAAGGCNLYDSVFIKEFSIKQ